MLLNFPFKDSLEPDLSLKFIITYYSVKAGPQGPEKLSSLKSLKIQTGVPATIRIGFLVKF